MINDLSAVRIVVDETLKERVLHARSPSRAKRRMRRGFAQHYIWAPKKEAYLLPNGTLVMHPATYAHLQAMISAEMEAIRAERLKNLGTPISQLSGRPGHPGYDEFKRIARSWGYD